MFDTYSPPADTDRTSFGAVSQSCGPPFAPWSIHRIVTAMAAGSTPIARGSTAAFTTCWTVGDVRGASFW